MSKQISLIPQPFKMAQYTLLGLLISQFALIAHGNFIGTAFTLQPDPTTYDLHQSYKVYHNRDNVVEDIQFRFYNGNSFSEHMEFNLLDSVQMLKQKEFDMNNMTIFYVHGWDENPSRESVQTVVTAYLKYRPEFNVVLVDWSNMAGGSYMTNAALNTRPAAAAVAREIKKMVDRGLPVANIHVVGHSLGGQVAGFIGENTQKYNIKLLRISALDPAFPLFYPGLHLGHISKENAEFVDVIHTAANQYGAPEPTGTVDFWPNGGFPKQPGCKKFVLPLSPEDMCSHWRSWMYWAESVQHPKAFASKRNPSDSNIAYMGAYADNSARGNYYLKTNSQYPFGKYENGI